MRQSPVAGCKFGLLRYHCVTLKEKRMINTNISQSYQNNNKNVPKHFRISVFVKPFLLQVDLFKVPILF